jgi:DNA-directed RNA polymerase subunit M/transcription elongation factor TFIIS
MKQAYRYDKIDILHTNTQLPKYICNFLETGIYNFATTYINDNNLDQNLFNSIYDDKLFTISNNINTDNFYDLAIKFDYKRIAYLNPKELNNSKWQYNINRLKYQEELKNDITFSEKYSCNKCNKKMIIVEQKQTRCADEGISTTCRCANCGFCFRL